MGAAKSQHMDDFIGGLKDLEIQNLVATQQRGLGIQFAKGQFTKTGGGNETVSLGGDLGLTDMENTSYLALMFDQANAVAVQIGTTLTVDGFDTGAGFAGGETIDVLIIGQIEDHPDP